MDDKGDTAVSNVSQRWTDQTDSPFHNYIET